MCNNKTSGYPAIKSGLCISIRLVASYLSAIVMRGAEPETACMSTSVSVYDQPNPYRLGAKLAFRQSA